MTYRLARGVDLKSRYGRFVYWFVMWSYALCVLGMVGAVLFLLGDILLNHFGLVS
jgi:hypothetical protein